ncbi:flagellar basal body P-ring formation chaperone FlgA [Thiohalobacter sp. IOR34]|uniref:flagellar basal body P-ring formation chaperone FlgA n=1 Tax=Thiohalobacter sp. IOR34 TaxID=3057176 RepID=UPI0025B259B5|nr:flagellar basal body P-ring formation chaperone FlgA [Thiohalobacter sp. IOR34]WJW74617.1 flagellar basal body P-ring formation chaperone FlgA [Thiohalobacter sp. IOR34]
MATRTRTKRQQRTRPAIVALLAAALLGGPAAGSLQAGDTPAHQDATSIRAAAQRFLEAQTRAIHDGRVEIRIGRLDSRLRLPRCGQPLQTSLPNGARLQGSTSVNVRCPGPSTWSIYVTGKIAVFSKVLVAARPLMRGEVIAPEMLQLAERDLARASYGYFVDPKRVAGLRLSRPVNAGTVITPTMLKARKLIKRGERVTLLAEQGGIQVRMNGEAISDGARGERIRVRASSSKRIIEGRVLAPGVVKVTL